MEPCRARPPGRAAPAHGRATARIAPTTGEALPLQPPAGNGREKFLPVRRPIEPHLSIDTPKGALHQEKYHPKVTENSAAVVIERKPIS